jgi:hypothetical protein
MKVGDKVTRRWKPALGVGTILHILGDKICVKWSNGNRPKVLFEAPKHLKVADESR